MTRALTHVLTLLLLVGLGCAEGPAEVEGSFGAQPRPATADEMAAEWEPQPRAVGSVGTVTVSGVFRGDLCRQQVEFRSLRHVDTLTAHLMFSAVPGDPICPQWIASTDYEAVFLHVEAGEYEVVTVHQYAPPVQELTAEFVLGTVTVQ